MYGGGVLCSFLHAGIPACANRGQGGDGDGMNWQKKWQLHLMTDLIQDYTEELLSGLKERGVSATFFLLGKEVEQYPEIVKKIHEGGHLIGTHAYEHVNLSNLTDAAAIEQVDKTNAAIHEIIGVFPEYIRPPFGCWKPNLDYETTMIEVLWDVDPKDWATSNSSVIAQRVLGDVEENDIILLHDASESSVLAAFKIIDELKAQGYTFVTVEDILLE